MDAEATGHEQSPMGCNFGAWLSQLNLQECSHRKAAVPNRRSLICFNNCYLEKPATRTSLIAEYCGHVYQPSTCLDQIFCICRTGVCNTPWSLTASGQQASHFAAACKGNILWSELIRYLVYLGMYATSYHLNAYIRQKTLYKSIQIYTNLYNTEGILWISMNTESRSLYLCLAGQVKAPVAHLRGALVSLHSLGGGLIMADHESVRFHLLYETSRNFKRF